MLSKPPKVRSASLSGFDKLVVGYGQNPLTILELAGVSAAVLREPELFIPYAAVAEILELAALSCRSDTIGLELGSSQGISTLGSLGLIAAQQPTLRDALFLAQKYAQLHAHGANVRLLTLGDTSIIKFNIDLPQAPQKRQLMQLSIGLIYSVICTMSGQQWRPQKLLLSQQQPKSNLRALSTKIGCAIKFEQDLNGIELRSRDLDIKPHPDENLLDQHFQQYLRDLEMKYPNQLIAQVIHCIHNLLPIGECSILNVANTLDIQPRVLQKRLKNFSTSFSQLLHETRYQLACDLMRGNTMSLTEIALHLGFAEPPIFSRNFKQWAGISPRQWRKNNVSIY
jgi:AraC-like DNA-binding protein